MPSENRVGSRRCMDERPGQCEMGYGARPEHDGPATAAAAKLSVAG